MAGKENGSDKRDYSEEQNRTKLQKEKMLVALTEHLGVVTPALKDADVSRFSYYDWLKKDEEFKAAVDGIQIVLDDFIENSLHALVNDKDTAATIYASKARLSKRGYSEKQTHEITGAGGGPLNVNINFVGPEDEDNK